MHLRPDVAKEASVTEKISPPDWRFLAFTAGSDHRSDRDRRKFSLPDEDSFAFTATSGHRRERDANSRV